MKNKYNRRRFIRNAASGSAGFALTGTLSSFYSGNPFIRNNSSGSSAMVESKSEYDWLNHARVFIVDGYTYPLHPKIEFNAEKMAEMMADMHANVLRISTLESLGWLIPGTEFKVADELGSRDILTESVAACKPRGIKVLPYLRCGASVSKEVMKPDWAQVINPRGEKSLALCWNTPYRNAFFDLVKTVVSKYDVDGVYFDSWLPFYSFRGRVCYCEGCRQGFKKVTGEEIPFRENGTGYSPGELKIIDRYREWYVEELYEVFKETKRIIKSYKDIPLIYNINNPSRILDKFQNHMMIMEESDALLYERGQSMIERAEGVSLAKAHGMIVWPYVGTYDQFPRIAHFNHELVQEIFTTFAFGGSPVLYHTYFFVDHPESRGPIKMAFKIIDLNYEYFKGYSSDKFCAIIYNDKDPAGHEINGYLWDTSARLESLGSFSACLKNHIQTTSLLKIDLDNPELLNQYKVLYLPDICSLTDSQVENIKGFVEKGGGLVMTYATSLYDEKGNRNMDFVLGDLARIRYHKPDSRLSERILEHFEYGGVKDLYLKTLPDQEVIRKPLSEGLIPTHVYETVDVLAGGTTVANLVTGHDNVPIGPGLVVSQYGKGRVAYISAAMGAMYMQTGISEFSDLIKNVVEYVSPVDIPYEIEAPHAVLMANMTVNGNNRVLHLVNWPGSQSERMWQNVYHIPPIENVTIKFRIPSGKKIGRITLFVPGDYSQKKEKNILYITLLEIKNYQGVLIETV